MLGDTFTARIVASLGDIDAKAWDACANPHGAAHNPFVSHAFLRALETSGSVGPRTGWNPAYPLVEDGQGRLIACAPTYIKTHSMGEYVFDHTWADAFERAGGRYYPKIQVAAPFTPVTGPRLLVAENAPPHARAILIGALRSLRDAARASSVHVTFCTQDERAALEGVGYTARDGEQFHFLNEGYRDFDDFLDALSARKRKAIKRERREALGDDITIDVLTGAELRSEHWDRFFTFYIDTGARKWGHPYLTRAFFDHVSATMADRILLVMARRDGQYIAGALNFLGDEAVYGRNWGALEERPFLHFEVCYYQAIDYAIRHGFKRVEAGAQGEHKLARGYRPVITCSAHDFADSQLGEGVASYLQRERAAVAAMMAEHEKELPFKRCEGS